MLKILTKIKNDEYTSVEQMREDIKLLVDNAVEYYEEDSEERDLANQLWNYFKELVNGKSVETSQSDSDKNQDWDEDVSIT